MHKSTSPKRKSFKLYAGLTSGLLAIGTAGALLAGVTPASAASLAREADTQIAIFMVPLTILVLAMLFEASRVVLRGKLPVEAPLRRTAHRYWSPGRERN